MTTYYVGNHYEVKNGVVTKYYFAGATRLAVRTNGTLSYLLGDHIGSSSVTTDANGGNPASALYKAFGETRYTLGNLGTDYKFTGQREEASLGIYFFNARWMDPSLGRFTSPDTIVPTSTQGTQAWDRYAFVNNNPVRYNDPTGHGVDCGVGGNEPCPGDDVADEENWPDDPPWDYYPAPIEWETDPIAVLFDPWAGFSCEQAFTDPDTYYSQYYAYRATSSQAYEEANLDMRQIVDNATIHHTNNPLTEDQAGEMIGSLLLRSRWTPYTDFLKVLGLGYGTDHITNYEPRFIEGLMVANKEILRGVMTTWSMANSDPLLGEMRQFFIQRGPGFGTSFTQ